MVVLFPLDPPLPPSWTVAQYATWSARLAGHRAAEGRALADRALETLELDAFRSTKLASASHHVRRAVVVAGALATGAAALLLEDPLAGLSPEVSQSLARRIVTATAAAGRRIAVFAARVPLESPLAVAADEAILAATLELLTERGYGGLTMISVIERAGVSSATL